MLARKHFKSFSVSEQMKCVFMYGISKRTFQTVTYSGWIKLPLLTKENYFPYAVEVIGEDQLRSSDGSEMVRCCEYGGVLV